MLPQGKQNGHYQGQTRQRSLSLQNAYVNVQEDYNLLRNSKVVKAHFGAKIVRGAYLEKEKKMAELKQYPCPINDSYEDTGSMYLKVVQYLIQQPHSYIVIATHNEQAVDALVTQFKKGPFVSDNNSEIAFAQIYGMGEQITMPLGNKSSLM